MADDNLVKRQLEQYAAELHRRQRNASGAESASYLTEPLLRCDALGQTKGMPLLGWLYFNPFGPTMCGLFFTPVPDSEERLIGFSVDNPFSKQWAAFGVVSTEIAAEHIGAILADLFLANGHDTCPLIRGIPTSIAHHDNWELPTIAPLFNAQQARILFKLAVQRFNRRGLKSAVGYLRRYKGDPWARTAAEFQEGLLHCLIRTDVTAEEFDEATYNEWFDLVTDPEHVRSEQKNFQAAWQGAIEHAPQLQQENSTFSQESSGPTRRLSKEDLRRVLRESLRLLSESKCKPAPPNTQEARDGMPTSTPDEGESQ